MKNHRFCGLYQNQAVFYTSRECVCMFLTFSIYLIFMCLYLQRYYRHTHTYTHIKIIEIQDTNAERDPLLYLGTLRVRAKAPSLSCQIWQLLATCGYLNLSQIKFNKFRNPVPPSHLSHFKCSMVTVG